MHPYRTHTCGELRAAHTGQTVRLSGWVHRQRDHGGLLFLDLRDTYGVTQCVVDASKESPELIAQMHALSNESSVTITGIVAARPTETLNTELATGEIELRIQDIALVAGADPLPIQVNSDADSGEDVRLTYRYLDLRRTRMQRNVKMRSDVIAAIRRRMMASGFREYQTPLLTASSPEGARDYLVPSRLYPGQFYALPQSPQQFKQLLMVSGFDRYFQIAPCFRDEDGRADRLPVHYQLDVEMAWVTQDDVFATLEPVVAGVFEEFSGALGTPRMVTKPGTFPRIRYEDAMLKYGSDKPDLRNPLEIVDVTAVFNRDDVEFKAFKEVIAKGGVVRAIRAPKVAAPENPRPRSFFDKLNDWARGEGAPGLGYIVIEGGEGKGPIAKFVPPAALAELKTAASLNDGDAVFFVCDKAEKAAKLAGKARDKICDDIGGLREQNTFKFCWIVDFPMYEQDEKTGKIDFSHNPFSMPQGGLEALTTKNPLEIYAYQYDCVCNGYELCSGAIRNHRPDIMAKAFEIAGYDRTTLESRFGGMLNAFRFGPPPHGGSGWGIDRIIMLILNEPNLREVDAFVMNGACEDLMMQAPAPVSEQQLKELGLKVNVPAEKKSA
jgi:aspartyl-tRNA synthetase